MLVRLLVFAHKSLKFAHFTGISRAQIKPICYAGPCLFDCVEDHTVNPHLRRALDVGSEVIQKKNFFRFETQACQAGLINRRLRLHLSNFAGKDQRIEDCLPDECQQRG